MAIISPLPYTIANGDPVDATPVQANLNQIVSNVNANAAPAGGSAATEFLVATTTNPAGAVPLAQAQAQFAALTGSSSQAFAVASGTGADAVPYTQMQSYVSANAAALNGSATQIFSVSSAASGSAQAPRISQTLGAGAGSLSNYGSTGSSGRSLSTTYTNNTGRPLWVKISYAASVAAGNGMQLTWVVNGVNASFANVQNTGSSTVGLSVWDSMVIPVGATYEVGIQNGVTPVSGSPNYWLEY